MIIIPKQRDCREDFLSIMRSLGFTWEIQELEGPDYRLGAFESEKESEKFYPGLKKLNFDLYTFK